MLQCSTSFVPTAKTFVFWSKSWMETRIKCYVPVNFSKAMLVLSTVFDIWPSPATKTIGFFPIFQYFQSFLAVKYISVKNIKSEFCILYQNSVGEGRKKYDLPRLIKNKLWPTKIGPKKLWPNKSPPAYLVACFWLVPKIGKFFVHFAATLLPINS